MATAKTRKTVTVRTADELGRALGLSQADTAEMEFRSELTVALIKDHSSRRAYSCRHCQTRWNIQNASDRDCQRQHPWRINRRAYQSTGRNRIPG